MKAPELTINPLGRRSAYRPKPQGNNNRGFNMASSKKHPITGSWNHGNIWWKYSQLPLSPTLRYSILSYFTLKYSTSPKNFRGGGVALGGDT